MRDISVVMYIEMPSVSTSGYTTEQRISHILNEACSKIEDLKCQVFYKMKDSNNKEIHLEMP